MSIDSRVLEAVGLIGHYVADQDGTLVGESELNDVLLGAGFSQNEIHAAFSWIEENTLGPGDLHVSSAQQNHLSLEFDERSERIKRKEQRLALKQLKAIVPHFEGAVPRPLTAAERTRITGEAHQYLLRLYFRGFLDSLLFEEVIERCMQSGLDEVSLHELRRTSALAIFNRVRMEWSDFFSGSTPEGLH